MKRGGGRPAGTQKARDRFTKRERPCARCGKRFTTTPARRMLCAGCFANG